MTGPLSEVARWPTRATAGWATAQAEELTGPHQEAFPWASVTKLLTALSVWIAVEEGSVAWDDPAGPPGATLAHLLSHASGLAPDRDEVLAPPGRRRIYSNRGFDLAAAHLADQAGMPFGEYLSAAVLDPLGLGGTTLVGSPASGASGPLEDLMRLGRELMEPTLVSPSTVAASTSVWIEGLPGVLPGFGYQEHNDWGLGVEVRDAKAPHWTGRLNSPATFGHFGRSGSFLWIDPTRGVLLASLAGQEFGPWAAKAWPALSDAVLLASGAGRS